MTFHSFTYGAFLALVVALFWFVHRRRNVRTALLLVSSYAFYAGFDWRYLGLIVFSTVLDYRVGKVLCASTDPRVRKAALLLSVTLNVGLLAFFKYIGWTVDALHSALLWVGFDAPLHELSLVLPIGISFYTFQTLSYSIDLYRGGIKPARNLLDFALFVAFFPQLVAGPIVRASEFLPQLELVRRFTKERLHSGLYRIALGLAKKVLIADVMHSHLVGPFFAEPGMYGPRAHVAVMCASMLRIYYDFSGYCDIAIGSATLLGFELPENFDLPFRSLSIREFWRRWHITLSSWVRDYIFQPLVGVRVSEPRLSLSLLLSIIVIGAWHGAAAQFVVYGALHGVVAVAEWHVELRYRRKYRRRFATTRMRRAVLWTYTCLFVSITSVFMHAHGVSGVVRSLTEFSDQRGVGDLGSIGWVAFFFAVLMHFLPKDFYAGTRARFVALPTMVAAGILGIVIGLAWYLLIDEVPFVYFQF